MVSSHLAAAISLHPSSVADRHTQQVVEKRHTRRQDKAKSDEKAQFTVGK